MPNPHPNHSRPKIGTVAEYGSPGLVIRSWDESVPAPINVGIVESNLIDGDLKDRGANCVLFALLG